MRGEFLECGIDDLLRARVAPLPPLSRWPRLRLFKLMAEYND
jgi:hypothetical protein